jgi:integrase
MQSEKVAKSKNSKNIGKFGTEQTDNDPNFERKLDLITEGTQPFVKKHLLTKISRVNCNVIIAYILAFMTEVNPKPGYRRETILKLKRLSEFHKNKPFKEMTRDDIIAFLERKKPKVEGLDPTGKWKGTHELERQCLLRFFRWLYAPNIENKKRPTPDVMYNIPKIRRPEEKPRKGTDIWTEEDELLFCKYCPSKREKALLRVARDTGFRASDLVKIKIKDLVMQQMADGSHTITITISNTKTGREATGRIYQSYPYLKDWLANGHPFPTVDDAPIFCGTGKKNMGRKIQAHTIWKIFRHHQLVTFPELLRTRLIEPEDVPKVKALLKKPWNPHWKRHIAVTEISKKVKDPVLVSRLLGWNPKGNTIQRYLHYDDNDAINALNAADGLVPAATAAAKKDLLKPKLCPNCEESNVPGSRFCTKCKFVLSFDAFNETIQESENTKKQLEEWKKEWKKEWEQQQEEIRRISDYISKIPFKKGEEPVWIGSAYYTENNDSKQQ